MPQKLWHWDYFVICEEDIPRAARKDYYGASQVFYNTWCKACLAQKVHELEQQDEEAKRQGRILHIRSHDETAEELAEIDTDEESTACSIRKLAEKLAQDVIDDKDPPEDDIEDDVEGNPLVGLEQQGMPGPRPQHLRLFFGTQYPILLKDLFNYNALDLEGQGLNIFKKAGLSNLQKELEVYDLLTWDVQKPAMTNEPED